MDHVLSSGAEIAYLSVAELNHHAAL